MRIKPLAKIKDKPALVIGISSHGEGAMEISYTSVQEAENSLGSLFKTRGDGKSVWIQLDLRDRVIFIDRDLVIFIDRDLDFTKGE